MPALFVWGVCWGEGGVRGDARFISLGCVLGGRGGGGGRGKRGYAKSQMDQHTRTVDDLVCSLDDVSCMLLLAGLIPLPCS